MSPKRATMMKAEISKTSNKGPAGPFPLGGEFGEGGDDGGIHPEDGGAERERLDVWAGLQLGDFLRREAAFRTDEVAAGSWRLGGCALTLISPGGGLIQLGHEGGEGLQRMQGGDGEAL